MFGEAIGVCSSRFSPGSSPARIFELVELGPGRGTLMADLWRSLGRAAPELRPVPPLLVEIGDALRAEQARRLVALAPRFARRGRGHRRRSARRSSSSPMSSSTPCRSASTRRPPTAGTSACIGLDGTARVWGLDPTPIPDAALPEDVRDAELDARFEIRPAAEALMPCAERKLDAAAGRPSRPSTTATLAAAPEIPFRP